MSDSDQDKPEQSSNGWSRCCPKVTSEKLAGFLLEPEDELVEVLVINSYAVFMGYLSMAVRGLGFLVVTWTTVVLLGGFVSVLGKKDFWCLTVITLSQTAGVFDVFLNEKLGSIWHACRGLFITTVSTTVFQKITVLGSEGAESNIVFRKATSFARRRVGESSTEPPRDCHDCLKTMLYLLLAAIIYTIFWALISLAKAAVQALVFVVVLLPLATLYMLGLYISTAISLWRLIQHDYGDDGGTNMKPALNVLYSLAVVQGLVFCYKIIFARHEKSMVGLVAEKLSSDDDGAVAVTWDYLRETKIGCEKDPSFARGRNLVTYALDLIESRSPASYLSGTRVLDVLLDSDSDGHGLLIRQLIGWGGSSSHVLQKLLGTQGPRSPYCRETRGHAASIVARLASQKQICLAQFPGGIQLISSMLDDTSQMDDGFRILGHLAADEGNRIVMTNTQGLLSSIMGPLGGLHGDHCRTWDRIEGLVSRLVVTAPGETGLKLRREISHNDKAVGALESILKCGECEPRDRIKANDILADLSFEMTSSGEKISSFRARKEENLIDILVENFVDVDKEDYHTHSRVDFAGSKLAELSLQSKSSAKLILRAKDDVAASIITIVEKKAYGSGSAAEILKNLCSHYTKDDECFDRLKKALTDAIPKVLREVLPWLTGEEIRAGSIAFSAPGPDLEIGCASQENAKNWEKGEGRRRKETLRSFCVFATGCDKLIGGDQDLSRQFDEIAAAICSDSARPVRTFASLGQEAREDLEAIEAQEALDEKKRAEEREKLPRPNPSENRGILGFLFPQATRRTVEALEAQKETVEERKALDKKKQAEESENGLN